MIERYIMKPLDRRSGAGGRVDAVWMAVGHRLQQRRAELGFSADRVALRAGVSAEVYAGYESGTPIPASLLAEVADLFGRPVVWFFQGVDQDEPAGDESPRDQPVTYTVATIEHRIQALADSFRKLDLEGQQHLLAISKALSRSNVDAARD